jgi:hypothetical protein
MKSKLSMDLCCFRFFFLNVHNDDNHNNDPNLNHITCTCCFSYFNHSPSHSECFQNFQSEHSYFYLFLWLYRAYLFLCSYVSVCVQAWVRPYTVTFVLPLFESSTRIFVAALQTHDMILMRITAQLCVFNVCTCMRGCAASCESIRC